MIYLEPEKYANCEESTWDNHFRNDKLEEFTKGAHMDGSYIAALADKAEDGAWKQSNLENVKQYIEKQLKG